MRWGQAVAELERRLLGDPARQKLSEPDILSIEGRVWNALIAGDLAKLEEAFAAAGAPWTLGRRVPQAL